MPNLNRACAIKARGQPFHANPAVTIARSLSDTFAGIAPSGVLAFVAAQSVGMVLALVVGKWLWVASIADK